ncbi:MAG: carbamoyltransferase HypF [Bacteroidetes bacterium]|nr:carbamoyltransferase HypF [Bacteroidota bacterium]
MLKETTSILIHVTGLVQGVGFRPFIHRLAHKYGLTGWVRNTNENVIIWIEGGKGEADHFLETLRTECPEAAIIEDIMTDSVLPEGFTSFQIIKSQDVSEEVTGISPDISVCNDCLEDMENEGTRHDYPFVNCTNCGPRFTIIRDLPYDRKNTTMEPFPLCDHCKKEFEDIEDRRFHAQPVACSVCGPEYRIWISGKEVSSDIHDIIDRSVQILESGGLLAVKGLGGMHLACDPFNDAAVEKLRNIKSREGKPFALMFKNIDCAREYTDISEEEEASLTSWRRPIVLLQQKTKNHGTTGPVDSYKNSALSAKVNAGLESIGVMFPYMPFHHMLLQRVHICAIILTSGNLSSEPILTENEKAINTFSLLVDAVIVHNREIWNRTDDSVVRIINGKERLIRRSRGYVPMPVNTSLNVDGIIAFGAELNNCFCVGKGQKAIFSQHIGDLKGLETTLFYEQTIDRFIRLFRIKPVLAVVDMHPDYISTKTGMNFRDLPVISVQHHHAHIASCMVQHGLDEKVIGVALDGTGYGDDGKIWGAEFMVCDLTGYKRINNFEYIPLPGGDIAAEEPWRMAVSYLYRVFGTSFRDLKLPFLEELSTAKTQMLVQMIDRKINCPPVSSAGRLFDAVSSLLNLCQVATFPAEGPMRIESVITAGIGERYHFQYDGPLNFDITIREIVRDILNNVDTGIISAKFHNTIIYAIFENVKKIREQEDINKVVLSGGVFQNAIILSGCEDLLRARDFEVYSHLSIPANDGGIALGQLIIAAKRREKKCV